MNRILNVWAWLSVAENQVTLGFIGGGLVAIIAGGWQAYLLFSEKPTETKPTFSASGQGSINAGQMTATATNSAIANTIVGNGNTVGDLNASANIKEIVTILTNQHQIDSQAKDEQVKSPPAKPGAYYC